MTDPVPRLTERRLTALRLAVAHPRGSIDARSVSKADEIALETLGYADSIDDCGHVQGAPDPDHIHRGHPHYFRITGKGRAACATAGTIAEGESKTMFRTGKNHPADATAPGAPDTASTETDLGLAQLRDLAELQREADRLLVATSHRTAYEELVARHDYLKEHGTNLREFAAVRRELAPYTEGRRPVPPPVDPAELITYHRRRIAVFGPLAEAGVEGAAESLAAAEAELAAACPFCRIAAGAAPAVMVREWDDAFAIRPRSGGVNEGHVLVIPRRHVADAVEDPTVSGATMTRACELGAELDCDLNLITSVGEYATQTVFHLHIHLVPRTAGDGLPLPWTPQHTGHRDGGHQ
ncbi:HIT family protein [Streptomyces sp. NBC_00078]|uniref:HIT family protein n=1 Tax=Streptomyces sp. NBC_00078 TaxID=2975643 RepID=UPI0022562008|nr:HIT family protein [Streptomyces sp. NBC_00078]MCX5426095.1 HIT family protein [Streptomyces sp. NBC_00078]